jgi:hypothetical protein
MIFWVNRLDRRRRDRRRTGASGKRTAAPGRGLGQLDLPGALAAVTGLAALVFGIQSAASDGWAFPRTRDVRIVSGLLLVAFGFIKRRVAHPLVPRTPGRSRPLVSGTGVMLGVTGLLVRAVLSSVFFQKVLTRVSALLQIPGIPGKHGGSAMRAAVLSMTLAGFRDCRRGTGSCRARWGVSPGCRAAG